MTNRHGITLIELMITIFILALLVLVVDNMFIAASRITRDENERIIVGDEAVRIFGPVDELLRQAKTVIASATINGTTYTSAADTLVFTIPSLQSGGQLSATETDTVVLTTAVVGSTTQLRIILDPGITSTRPAQDQGTVNDVDDIYFRYNASTITNATAVTVTLTTSRSVLDKPFKQTALLYATFRNHL